MSAALPAALQAAIARFADDVAPKDLAARSASLTRTYRSGAGSQAAITDNRDVAAYLTTRLPATYAAMGAALAAVKERAPGFAPTRLLDAGSGPGTASWAAAAIWPQLDSFTMLDRNPHLLAAARTLASTSDHPSLSTATFISGDLTTHFPPPFTGEVSAERTEGGHASAHQSTGETPETTSPNAGRSTRRSALARGGSGGGILSTKHYDLVLAGYTFAELPSHARERALANLWNACRGVLVIVEPGTPAGFATVLACRTALLAQHARMVAPCPAAYPCPIVSPDWCHFAARLPRTRAHMRAKDATVPFEDEKFSYLAVAREGILPAPVEARIIALPHAGKPGVRLRLCTEGTIDDRMVLKRDKDAYKAVSRKTWGDAL